MGELSRVALALLAHGRSHVKRAKARPGVALGLCWLTVGLKYGLLVGVCLLVSFFIKCFPKHVEGSGSDALALFLQGQCLCHRVLLL